MSEERPMINRRQFLANFSLLAVAPWFAVPRDGVIVQPLQLTPKIKELEASLRLYQGFSWWHHNELRHEYLPISEKISRQHADAILTHSIMDEYILNTVTDWHLTDWNTPSDPNRAIAILLD